MPDSRDEHSVPEVASGFIFQVERALYHLANARADCVVGVETDDDVAVRRESLVEVSEQDKISYQSSGHPFQDRSPGLWKTLLIWLSGYRRGLVVERYCAVTSRRVPTTSLVHRMASASLGASAEGAANGAADLCIADLRRIGATLSGKLRPIAVQVCGFPDDALRAVILRMVLVDGSSLGQRQSLKASTVAAIGVPAGVDTDAVYNQLLGWLADLLQQKWAAREPGWVERQHYVNVRQRVISGQQRERVLERARQLVPIATDQLQAARSREFVSRLVEIDVDSRVLADAIEDLLKFEAEFVRLLQEGEVLRSDWDAMFYDMERRWRDIARRTMRTNANRLDHEIGQALLSDTIDPDYRPCLRNERTTHGYFAAGGYHRLADDMKVGWHPRHLRQGR